MHLLRYIQNKNMKRLFAQTAIYSINNTICSDFFKKLPEVIRKHTDWDYSIQQTDTGCFLKPTFRNMPYRNSFVPEIDIVVSCHEEHNVLHMSGQPVKAVRIFMALWFGLLLLMEGFLIVAVITSKQNSLFNVLIPLIMCAFGYLLCKFATKATFNSVVKAIQKECL